MKRVVAQVDLLKKELGFGFGLLLSDILTFLLIQLQLWTTTIIIC